MKNRINSLSQRNIDGALRFWRYGALGTLGLQYFYAGRFSMGIGQCLVGMFLWALLVISLFEPADTKSKFIFALSLLALLLFISVRGYMKIKRGQFTDCEGHIIY